MEEGVEAPEGFKGRSLSAINITRTRAPEWLSHSFAPEHSKVFVFPSNVFEFLTNVFTYF